MNKWRADTDLPTYEGLDDAINLLHSEKELNQSDREYIAACLDLLGLMLALEEADSKKGRRPEQVTWRAASLALDLVDRYNVKQRGAIKAVLGRDNQFMLERIERACQKIKSGEGRKILFSEDEIEKVAEKLKTYTRKRPKE